MLSEEVCFTDHEKELLLLVSEGLDRKCIAERLQRNPHTIGQQLTRLYLKLGAKNRMQALLLGQQRGLFTGFTPATTDTSRLESVAAPNALPG